MKTTLRIYIAIACLCAPVLLHAQTPGPNPTPTSYIAPFQVLKTAPLADRQAYTAAIISRQMVSSEAMLLQNFRTLYNQVWHNANGLTPQQVCDGLGAKAGDLFVVAGTMQRDLYALDPAGIGSMVNVPAGYAATINPDNTVTITYTAPAASPTPTP